MQPATGRCRAVDDSLLWIKVELERSLGTEELPTRLDFHAFAATIALERGDYVQAASEADDAMKAIIEIGQKSSVVNTYCSMYLVARVFANLWIEAHARRRRRSSPPEGHGGGVPGAFKPGLVVSHRRAGGGYHPRLPRAVPRPHGDREALLATGRQRTQIASRWATKHIWRCTRSARRASGSAEARGLPFLIREGATDAR